MVLALVSLACQRHKSAGTASAGDAAPPPPSWHFVKLDQQATDVTLTDVWGRSDGALFAVGWYGTILTNAKTQKNPAGNWTRMASPTTEHLTAIYGVENGARFGLPAPEGEMFAVGWHGTLLDYNPNPDGDPKTDDGTWSLVAGPGAGSFTPLLKVDPYCPDYDGDGIPDDGDGDGWWGNNICHGGASTGCDDNCRKSANGTMRPLVDTNGDGCLGPGDGPSSDTSRVQRDADNDGIGEVCDSDDSTPNAAQGFDATLFDVWAAASGANVMVVAVGEKGALISYNGPSAAETVAAPALPITNPAAWTAQLGLPFRYTTDCPLGTPVGTTCGSGRLPPSCPAQCSPLHTTCTCNVSQGQCCDATASTGAGCADGSCPPAQNACNTTTGLCSTLCPSCFRRLDQTLRAVSGHFTDNGDPTDDSLLVVGAEGFMAVGDPNDPTATWSAPSCSPPPPPLDERPLLAAVSGAGANQYQVVGANGAVFRVDATAGTCGIQARSGAPPAFLSGVFALSADRAYAAGDRGLLLRVNGGANPQVAKIGTPYADGLQSVWVTHDAKGQRLVWMVGASGTVIRGAYY